MNKKVLFLIGLRVLFTPCFLLGMDDFLDPVKMDAEFRLLEKVGEDIELREKEIFEFLEDFKRIKEENRKAKIGFSKKGQMAWLLKKRLFAIRDKRDILEIEYNRVKNQPHFEWMDKDKSIKIGRVRSRGKLKVFLDELNNILEKFNTSDGFSACGGCGETLNDAFRLSDRVSKFYKGKGA